MLQWLARLFSLLTGAAARAEADRPWVQAITQPEVLDWKQGLTLDKVNAIAVAQTQHPIEIAPALYLSDARRAHDVALLRGSQITHVLNVAGRAAQGPAAEYEAAGINVLNIEADDEEGYPMLARHLADCRSFIAAARSANGRCLVHCVAGINRSGVVVAAEKMLSERLPVLEVVRHCRRQRGNIFLCNESFAESLVALARKEGLLGPEPEPESSLPQPATGDHASERPRPFKPRDIKALF